MRKQWLKYSLLIIGIIAVIFLFVDPVFAQQGDLIDQVAMDEFALEAGFDPDIDIRVIVARIIRTILTFMGVVLIGYLIYGGFLWMTAGGEKDKIDKARKTIINAIIGVAIVLSSWAIASFVINRLVSAIGGGVGETEDIDVPTDPVWPPDYDVFVVESFGCADGEFALTNMNVVVSILFSQNVNQDSIDGGIQIREFGGDQVDGTYTTGYHSVTFVPDSECPDDPGEYCFDPGATYTITIGGTLISTGGDIIECGQGAGCNSSFTVGSLVDLDSPTAEMISPEDGEPLEVYLDHLLQALAIDDGGINNVFFFVDGDEEDNTDFEVLGLDDVYAGVWNSPDLGSHTLYAQAFDCAGNYGQSALVNVDVQPLHCFNELQDEDETGEDCGGADCGLCAGDACVDGIECRSGICENGICVGYPAINMVSPTSGAPGNFVTISGEYFGETEGVITFLGTDTDEDDEVAGDADDVVVSLAACDGAWSNTEVIIEIPEAGVSGPIMLEQTDPGDGTDPLSDRTDDLDRGARINDFTINDVSYPGLCGVDPASEYPGLPVSSTGKNFGDAPGIVYFVQGVTGYESPEYSSWTDTALSYLVPELSAGSYYIQAVVDGSGSNLVRFSTLAETIAEEPVINYLDSGLMGCNDRLETQGILLCTEDIDCTGICEGAFARTCSNDVNTSCDNDESCNFGICDDLGDHGPIGQYVTLYGTDFGDNQGFVKFTDVNGDDHTGETTFPAACEGGFWTDDQITIKVSDNATVDELYDVWVQREDQVESNSVEFQVIDGAAGPGICLLTPSSGPAGLDVTIDGENFAAIEGIVEFWQDKVADVADDNWLEEAIVAQVPADAVTGSVQVTRHTGQLSNTLNFTVGNCNEIDGMCSETETCCGDGSCWVECPIEEINESEYVWRFSTGDIPEAPTVMEECSESWITPTPATRWDGGDEVCVNAQLAVAFTQSIPVDMNSINSTTVLISECISGNDDPCDELSDPLEGNITEGYSNNFYWQLDPANLRFSINTWHQVTLLGGENGIVSDGGIPMERDYTWQFQTRNDADDCDPTDVYLVPAEHTLTFIDDEITYLAAPIGQYPCELLIDPGYDWDWTAEYEGPTQIEQIINFLTNAQLLENNENEATAQAISETEAGYLIDIISRLVDFGLQDEAELIVDFSDPHVVDNWPECNETCTNATIGAEFSEEMDVNSFANNVIVYNCADMNCSLGLQSVGEVNTDLDDTGMVADFILPFDIFAADSYYFVVIQGDNPATADVEGVTSTSGSGLTQLNDTLLYRYTWAFHTKADLTPCGVERVEVEPDEAMMSYVGQRQVVEAIPYGAPDECRSSGQRLTASVYNWVWDIDQLVGVNQDWTIAVFDPLELDTTTDLPDGCSSICLNTGSQSGLSVCGNNSLEFGEDCDDGNTAPEDGCSSNCLHEGFDGVDVFGTCGNGVIDIAGSYPEECDNFGLCADDSTVCDQNSDCTGISGGYCADETTFCETDVNCEEIGGLCPDELTTCQGDEDCLGIDTEVCVLYETTCNLNPETCTPRDGDGCSAECLNEGSRNAGAVCGDLVVNHEDGVGGEECDDGNTSPLDGCSNVCLNEGSSDSTIVFAVCGNGGEPEPGEDCDDGNAVDGDQCSSNCLTEDFLSLEHSLGTCGNGIINSVNGISEECDDGENEDGDGCSEGCLLEGSSYLYEDPSFCGDATPLDTGEECEASAINEVCGILNSSCIDPVQIAVITDDAAQAVLDSGTNQVSTDLSAQTTDDYENTEIGYGEIGIICACEEDEDCGDEAMLGCGLAQCCFIRPNVSTLTPNGDSAVCRNTYIAIEFDQTMDQASLRDNIMLVYLGLDYNLDLENDPADGEPALLECPDGYTQYPEADLESSMRDRPWYARAWNWVKGKVVRFLGIHSAIAEDLEVCIMDINFDFVDEEGVGTTAVISYGQALEANGAYRLVVGADPYLDDDNLSAEYAVGVLSGNLVSLPDENGADYGFEATVQSSFRAGGDICTLDLVTVQDRSASPGIFTTSGEEHRVVATALASRGLYTERIAPINDYSWDWSWETSEIEVDEDVVENSGVNHNLSYVTTVETAIEGDEWVIASATIIADNINDPSTVDQATSGEVEEMVYLCENPWPAVGHFPFEDTDEGDADYEAAEASGDFGESVRSFPDEFPYSNFSFYYCRDAGEPGDTSDDLPALTVIEAPESVSQDVFREILFIAQGDTYSDAIGVRIASNEEYYSPATWFADQGFIGSPSEAIIDGYQAVQDGRTTYIGAANQTGNIWSNIYVISYNATASEETIDIYEQVLDSWTFNANSELIDEVYIDVIHDVDLCYQDESFDDLLYDTNDDGQEVIVSCEYDYDCDILAIYPDAVCGDEKVKLQRDLKRLTDFQSIMTSIEEYGDINRHCSVTKGQSCYFDDSCPEGETCVDTVPELEVGSFLRSRTVSAWPSWQAHLANDLGVALPVDPLNSLVNCPEGSDPDTCWDATSSQFTCYENSHVYGYRSIGGENYELIAELEYNDAPWAHEIDDDVDNYPSIIMYGAANAIEGFTTDAMCDPDGTVYGDSASCGDGVIGQGETCEVSDTTTVSCTRLVCQNADEPSYNGQTCTFLQRPGFEPCGPSGTCVSTDGVKAVACCDALGNCDGQVELACDRYQEVSESDSECMPYTCGNGVVENDELCDDGSFNGIYGYCGEDCNYEGAIFCGDGSLAGNEICDCGYNAVYLGAGAYASGICDQVNGIYSLDPDLGCAFDCSGPPAHCGDGVVQDSEICDSETEQWSEKLCSTGTLKRQPCESDDDCNGGVCGGSTQYEACGSATVCESGDESGSQCDDYTDCPCTDEDNCPDTYDIFIDGDDHYGSCSDYEYALTRTRLCDTVEDNLANACEWGTWETIDSYRCLSSSFCGNGVVEGNEVCDDGNDSNNDECTQDCQLNVCGDGYLYTGQESCDFGAGNDSPCEPPYGGTCNFCTVDCQYQTTTGGYCGDGEINGNELCDGSIVPTSYCFKGASDPTERNIGVACTGQNATFCETNYPDEGYTCENDIGYCNGGYYLDDDREFVYTAEPCRLNFVEIGDELFESLSSDISCAYYQGEYQPETGTCVTPVCDANCLNSCPMNYEEATVLIQAEAEETTSDSIELYSYLAGENPDTSTLYFPACSVATSLTVDVSFENIEDPEIDVVILLDGSASMRNEMSGNVNCSSIDKYCEGGNDEYDECTDGPQCDSGSCIACESRAQVAKEVLAVAISDLFGTFEDGKINIGIATYDSCNVNTIHDPADSDELGGLLSAIYELDDYPSGGTGTVAGFEGVGDIFDDSEADEKVLIFIGDGETTDNCSYDYICINFEDPNYNNVFCDPGLDQCGDDGSCFPVEVDGISYTVARIAADHLKDNDISIYTAAILTDGQSAAIGEMAHYSSEECDGVDYDDRGDCESLTGVPYAYVADTEDEFEAMLDAIIDALRGLSMTYTTVVEVDGAEETIRNSVVVLDGVGLPIPLPAGFECDDEEIGVPFRVEFNGTGPVSLENIIVEYCPVW